MGLLIAVGFVVLVVAAGAVSQVLKVAQQPAAPPVRRPGAVRPASGDIDRFLEEIDRLRRKKAEGGGPADPPPTRPVARPVARPAAPVAAPARRRPDAPSPPVARPVAPPVARPVARPLADPMPSARRLEDMPTAPPPMAAAPPSPVYTGSLLGGGGRPPAVNPFARQIVALLKSPQSVATAVVLQEVLGPPKCKRLG